ncbi:MAG TPA: ferric reductase-like transmembrane domain-containing protein [Thermomicrobiales bacterium]|jgi:predicted ferric reductase|nr:ferric reductase-like transmembrane domain-containing protein [Thermomicrobiales bacterium]
MLSLDTYWYVGRGSGIVAYLLLTIIVVLGIALSRRWHNPRWPRVVVHEAHRWATITFYVFLVLHVAFLLLDPFFGLTVWDVTVPFLHPYRPLWFGLGIVAAELALAMGASVWLRGRIGYRAWHLLHGLAYPIFIAALLHGVGVGTDSGTWWMTALFAGSAIAVTAATAWRFVRPMQAQLAVTAASILVIVGLFGQIA